MTGPPTIRAVLILRECGTCTPALLLKNVFAFSRGCAEIHKRCRESVRPGLGSQVDRAAGEASEFRSQIVGLYPEFLDGVLRRHQRRQVDVNALIGAPSI